MFNRHVTAKSNKAFLRNWSRSVTFWRRNITCNHHLQDQEDTGDILTMKHGPFDKSSKSIFYTLHILPPVLSRLDLDADFWEIVGVWHLRGHVEEEVLVIVHLQDSAVLLKSQLVAREYPSQPFPPLLCKTPKADDRHHPHNQNIVFFQLQALV